MSDPLKREGGSGKVACPSDAHSREGLAAERGFDAVNCGPDHRLANAVHRSGSRERAPAGMNGLAHGPQGDL
ncbi:hypothetical protein MKK69_27025 [Methylobacterium sp. J-026]|uniref:hypothetical protein n=1 Tax=Methylobacterium sp. J-026 TaxID=2836624 RepID=UPI001FBBE536|nr:hypothetical protein [Methylobacterium sp. J-026]MCJ2137655.1 hypothetical protein [Methylobacterium sp. J-026]